MIQIKRSELKQLAQNKLGDDSLESQNKILVMISTAMAARTSYTMVGDEKGINYERMIELHDRLIAQDPPHSSPMEHCARAMSDQEFISYFRGELPKEDKELTYSGRHGWCRNFKGFIPYRHIIESK